MGRLLASGQPIETLARKWATVPASAAERRSLAAYSSSQTLGLRRRGVLPRQDDEWTSAAMVLPVYDWLSRGKWVLEIL